MTEDLQQEIIELQTKIQFQEDTIQQLDQMIIGQGEKIELLIERLKLMEGKVEEFIQAQGDGNTIQQEKPPHY